MVPFDPRGSRSSTFHARHGVSQPQSAGFLSIDTGLMEELNRSAKDDLRTLNAQIEYLLRNALRRRRRREIDTDRDEESM